MPPLLTICTIAYNQEKFIAQTLEGFVAQSANFYFEALVADDCSTDNTAKIIAGYAERYPEIIKPVLRDKNVGMIANFSDVLFRATGKYLAFCEGDDYWTDPHKLQKQVDFLDAHPDFVLCVHNVKVVNETPGCETFITKTNPKVECTIEDVIEYKYPLPTCGMVIRNGLVRSFPPWFSQIHNADWAFQILLAQFGKVRYMDDPMGIHNQHKGGISATASIEYQNNKLITLLRSIDEHFNFKYKHIINKRLARAFRSKAKLLFKKHSYITTVVFLLRAFIASPGAFFRYR